MFALVDCNNFYVSCERVFNPRLLNSPVVVLSNNDGCIVSMSNEVKELGIKIGTPIFKCKDLIKKNNINVLSSNYTLYADMSNRVMSILKEFSQDIEIYSIDEAFISLSNLYIKDKTKYGKQIRKKILKCTGIPVSIGIARTKVLTKIANKIAKKDKALENVLDISNSQEKEIDKYLSKVDVIDVWGIGPKYAKKLNSIGIYSAKDLKYADHKWIRRKTNVLVERIILELLGMPCYNIENRITAQKSITSSRSFRRPIIKIAEMKEAISSYVANACERLRSQKSFANIIVVYLKTNKFKKGEKQYSNAAFIKLPFPTASTIELTKYALWGISRIFKSGYKYKKAGIILDCLEPSKQIQSSLFPIPNLAKRESLLMKVIDKINNKFGRGTIWLACEGIRKQWEMRRNLLSKRYTTNINEILTVKV